MSLQLSRTFTFLDANNREIPASVYGGSESDRIDVSSWLGTLWANGEAGNDTIYGTSASDTLYGGSGNDSLYGNAGNAVLVGQEGHDYLYGGTGNDRLYGSETYAVSYNDGGNHMWGEDGNDELRGGNGNDWLYGGTGNDNLYGGGGNDNLYGEAGNDGLFGGAGVDVLDGGVGADRYLLWGWDFPATVETIDAAIQFSDSGPQTFRAEGGGTVMYGAGTWTEAEIERIDVALGNLHAFTGNTRLLKGAKGVPLAFERLGAALNAEAAKYDGLNGGGVISYNNSGMARDDLNLAAAVYHEVGHNWDDPSENRYAAAFRQISDWRARSTSDAVPSGFQRATNLEGVAQPWIYSNTATFAEPYGQTNPFEDYATTFETYFLRQFHGTTNGNNNVVAKQLNIGLLMFDLMLQS